MAEVAEDALIEEGAIPPDDFHDAIERIVEVAEWELELPADLIDRLGAAAGALLLEPGALREAAAALATGHLVLQGPPGTGKSSLCRALCEAFGVETLPVTAHEDWSTFEVIGRQELRATPDGEEISPVNGFFTEAVIRCAGAVVRHFDEPAEPQACWLVIDELNRAQPDKAFGELFSVLGTSDLVEITLPHQAVDNRVLVTPRRFRIVATMNSIDRDFVNALSQGLRRRFTFLTIDIPAPRRPDEMWGSEAPDASLASREFSVVQQAAVARVAQRQSPAAERADASQRLSEMLLESQDLLRSLFEFVERVRYAGPEAGDAPHLPIGTAPLIDTVELFLSRLVLESLQPEDRAAALDWAVSVKLIPLFDVGTVNREAVREFANALAAPLNGRTRKGLLHIAAEGMFFVG
jgi:MoxR-like ATPase